MRVAAALVRRAFSGPAPRDARQLARAALVSVFFPLLVLAVFAPAAFATDFTVTTTADTNDGACNVNACSLRDAIAAANLNAGADRVVLGTGQTYLLSLGRLTVTDA